MELVQLFAPSLLGAILLSIVLLLTGRLKFLDRPGNGFLDVASGIAIAYVFVDILPHLAGKQRRLSGVIESGMWQYLEHHVYLIALAGFCLYLGIELSLNRGREKPGRDAGSMNGEQFLVWLVALSIWLYSFFMGYFLAEQATHSYEPTLLFSLAVACHFIGLNHVFYRQRPAIYEGKLRYVYAIAPLLGCLTGIVTELSDAAFAVGFSWLAGGVISSAMSLELPRIQSSRQFCMFSLGVAGFAGLIILTEAVR